MRFGHTRTVRVIPPITAAAYSAGNNVGGVQTVGPLGSPFSRGIMKNISIVDKANQKAAMTILLFNDNPADSTFTDKAAPVIHANDEAKYLGKIEIATTDWTTIGAKAVCTKECSTVIAGASDAARKVYAVAMVTATPTYASIADLTFTYSMLLD